MRETCEALDQHEDDRLTAIGTRLHAGIDALRAAAEWLTARRHDADGLAGATPFLKLMGDVAGGWLLAKGALSCVGRSDTDPYARARIGIASHYAETLLAQAPGKVASVIAGGGALKALDEAALS
jgi:hypothetical protein